MGLAVYFIALIVYLIFQVTRAERYCYAQDSNPYLFLGTKTAYDFVSSDDTSPVEISGCEASKFWLLSRHGTRYPSEKDYTNLLDLPGIRDQIIDNHNRNAGDLCAEDLENLGLWEFNVTEENTTLLTEKGKSELRQIARRYQLRFPSILDREYNENLYDFQHTNEERTRVSATSFAEGLFGDSPVNIPHRAAVRTAVKSHYNCTRWIQNIENNPEAFTEANLFQEGDIMKSVIQSVSRRLGFDHNLTYWQVQSMFDMCRYNKAWQSDVLSPWCAVFHIDELKILEYMEDLLNYYESGYGHEINLELGCAPIKDFIHHFRNTEENQPIGLFYFSHSTATRTLLSRLGIAKDEDVLKHSNYYSMRDRKWRTSLIGAFSTNLAVVYFKCETEPKIMFFLEEKLLPFEGCDNGICSLKYIEDKFSDVVDNCDLSFCDVESKPSPPWPIFSHSVTAIVVTLILHLFGKRFDKFYLKISKLYQK